MRTGFMNVSNNHEKVLHLMNKGVSIPNPESVDIGEEVDPEAISGKDVVIYSGCKLYGKHTLVMSGAKLGYEAPATIQDCQIGPHVQLKGGFFQNSVFFENARMGSCAHVREACIIEEEANAGHSVGLKHTILFPFVTLGSLINLCDCLMAGGTSRKNHSEVGSSYIHFNYTPNQDKATPSLIGDVARGVMLDQSPIFLGGQGGLVGPARVEFGTTVAAGVILRNDILEENRLITAHNLKDSNLNFYPGLYRSITRVVTNNTNYIANLIALKYWYLNIRSQFFPDDLMGKALLKGSLEKLGLAIHERMHRFEAFIEKLPQSTEIYKQVMGKKASDQLIKQKKALFDQWPEMKEILLGYQEQGFDIPEKQSFLERIASEKAQKGNRYTEVIQGLEKKWRDMGSAWLSGIIRTINDQVLEKVPFMKAPT